MRHELAVARVRGRVLRACLSFLLVSTAAPFAVVPPFGFLNQTTEFAIKADVNADVAQCTTAFGASQQSVFSSETKTGGMVCTIVPPATIPTNVQLFNATLSLLDSHGEPATPQLIVPFVRIPTISRLWVAPGDQTSGETVLMSLAGTSGLQAVLTSHSTDIQLTVPAIGSGNGFTVPGRLVTRVGVPLLEFVVDTVVPQGAYPVLVTMQGHELMMQTEVPPCLSFSRVTVRLSAAVVPLADISASSRDKRKGKSLAVKTDRRSEFPVTVLLSLVHASINQLTRRPDVSTPISAFPSAPSSGTVVIADPGTPDKATYISITFPPSSPASRSIQISYNSSDVPELGYVVRIIRVLGGVPDEVQGATHVAAKSEGELPRFDVHNPQAVYRGSPKLTMNVTRTGRPSLVPSVVHWTVSALEDSMVTQGSRDILLQALPDVDALPVDLTAVLGATTGTLVWDPSETSAKAVVLDVDWTSVPYTARWQLALRLSPLWNAEVPRSKRNSKAIHPRDDVQGLVYGVPENTCPPGGQRIQGVAANIPVLAHTGDRNRIQGIMLQSVSNTNPSGSYDTPTPAFSQNISTYTTVVQHGSVPSNLVIVVAGQAAGVVHANGCGISFASSTSTRWKPHSDSSNPGDASMLALSIPLSPLRTSCTISIAICVSTVCTSSSFLSYTLSVTLLSDPKYSQLASVELTVRGQRHVLCAHKSAIVDARRQLSGSNSNPALTPAAQAAARLLVRQNKTALECGDSIVMSANIYGMANSVLTIDANPLYESMPGTQVAIGQRMFVQGSGPAMQPSLSLKVAGTASDLSLPLQTRMLVEDGSTPVQIYVDIPVTLTLDDGITALQRVLTLGLYYNRDLKGGRRFDVGPTVKVMQRPDTQPLVQQMDLWPQDPMNSKQCRPCSLGSYTYSVDAATCLRCSPGTSAPQHGMTECLVCPPGSYSPIFGASLCARCLPGFYAPINSSSACLLCPAGYTAATGGSATCSTKIADGLQIGVDYALAVYFQVVINGTSLVDVPALVGVAAEPEDVVSVLVTADTSQAFNISSSDVEVTSIVEISKRVLRVDITANLGMRVPPDATQEEIETALAVAQLSKDRGIGKLSWSRTTQALGAHAQIVEDGVTTEVRTPEEGGPPLWPTIVFPVLACLVVFSTFMLLRYRKVRVRLQPTASDAMQPSFFSMSTMLFSKGVIRSDSTCSGSDSGCCPSVPELPELDGQTRKRGQPTLIPSMNRP